MNKEMIITKLIEEVCIRLSPKGTFKLEYEQTVKNNGTPVHTIRINKAPNSVWLHIHINELFNDISQGNITFIDAAAEIVRVYEESQYDVLIPGDVIETLLSLDNILAKVRFAVINTKLNIFRLEQIPHFDFLNLSAIYKADLKLGIHEGAITIDNNLMTRLGLNETDLRKAAMKNMKGAFTCKSMLSVLGLPFVDILSDMYLVGNSTAIDGAAVLLFPECFEMLAQLLDRDLFILPSSIHEVIAVRANADKISTYKEIVQSVNQFDLEPTELLSDSVYLYSRKTKTITMV